MYIISSTLFEHNNFLKSPYFFQEDQVWQTGLARFDRLINNDKKKIMISFTWQDSLAPYNNPTTEMFLNSDYYKSMLEILENKKIFNCACKNGYQICVKLHPMMSNFIETFEVPEYVCIWDKDYNTMFAECSLLVTDHSSITSDFAMLKKPVIYYQSDKENMDDHVWSIGDYSYEEQGYGEVVNNIIDLENLVCEYIENGCQLKEKYEKRIESSFFYIDHNNCERIYKKTKKMIEENNNRFN